MAEIAEIDPRRDRDPLEPFQEPPVDDPEPLIPDEPVDEPEDLPGHGEPGRRDPQPEPPGGVRVHPGAV